MTNKYLKYVLALIIFSGIHGVVYKDARCGQAEITIGEIKNKTDTIGCGYYLRNFDSNKLIFWDGANGKILINIDGTDLNLERLSRTETDANNFTVVYQSDKVLITIWNTITSRAYEGYKVDARMKIELDGAILEISVTGGDGC